MIILQDENSNFIASIALILNNIVIKSHLPMIREETFVFDISDVNNICLINPEIHRLEEYHTEEEVKESIQLEEEVKESVQLEEEVKESVQLEEVKTKRKSKRGKKV